MAARRSWRIQAVAQLLAGLEERDVLLVDPHAVAGARVAPEPRIATLDRKRTKASELDAIAARQRSADLVEDRRHDQLDVALVEVRGQLGQTLDEFRLRHGNSPRRFWRPIGTGACQTRRLPSRRSQ